MKKQSDKLNKILKKNGGVLCDLAKISALSIDSVCRFLYYEPKEPEKYTEFIADCKKQKR